jgi:hypothetical protein
MPYDHVGRASRLTLLLDGRRGGQLLLAEDDGAFMTRRVWKQQLRDGA